MTRREHVSMADRLTAQRDAKVKLRRHLNLVPEPPPQRSVNPDPPWNPIIVPNIEWTAAGATTFTYSYPATSAALAPLTWSASPNSTVTLNWSTDATFLPVQMMPGSIVTYNVTGANAIRVSPYRAFDVDYQPTPAQEAARVQRELQLQERRRAAHEHRITAQNRATETLRSFMTEQQRADYEQHEYFYVEGSAGNLYRIDKGNAGNVMYCDRATRRPLGSICAHPSMAQEWIPDQDVALAQMLALMTDEPRFTAIANVHWGLRPPSAQMNLRPERNTPYNARQFVDNPLGRAEIIAA